MANNRRFTRVSFPAAVTLVMGGQRIDAEVLDLSLKGALVRLPATQSVGTPTDGTLELRLDGSEVLIEMAFQVAFHTGDRVGLQCVSIDVDSMVHLRRLLELNLGDPALVERELAALG